MYFGDDSKDLVDDKDNSNTSGRSRTTPRTLVMTPRTLWKSKTAPMTSGGLRTTPRNSGTTPTFGGIAVSMAVNHWQTAQGGLAQSSTIVEPSSLCGQRDFGYYIGSDGKHYIKQQIINFKLTDTVTW